MGLVLGRHRHGDLPDLCDDGACPANVAPLGARRGLERGDASASSSLRFCPLADDAIQLIQLQRRKCA